MKKIVCFFFIVLVVVILAGCSVSSVEGTAHVDLYNIDDYTVDEAIFELSETEMNSVIVAKFSAVDIEIDPELLTNDDVKVFGCNSVLEFKESIIKDIVCHRFIEEYYSQLLEKSIVKQTPQTEKFKNTVFETAIRIAEHQSLSVDDYIGNIYQMNVAEFKCSLEDLWTNMQIIFAYCDLHAISCSETEMEEVWEDLKDVDEFRCYTENEQIRRDVIKYFILDEKLKEGIAHSNKETILQITSKVVSKTPGLEKDS